MENPRKWMMMGIMIKYYFKGGINGKDVREGEGQREERTYENG
jgi:hypothetical protein